MEGVARANTSSREDRDSHLEHRNGPLALLPNFLEEDMPDSTTLFPYGPGTLWGRNLEPYLAVYYHSRRKSPPATDGSPLSEADAPPTDTSDKQSDSEPTDTGAQTKRKATSRRDSNRARKHARIIPAVRHEANAPSRALELQDEDDIHVAQNAGPTAPTQQEDDEYFVDPDAMAVTTNTPVNTTSGGSHSPTTEATIKAANTVDLTEATAEESDASSGVRPGGHRRINLIVDEETEELSVEEAESEEGSGSEEEGESEVPAENEEEVLVLSATVPTSNVVLMIEDGNV